MKTAFFLIGMAAMAVIELVVSHVIPDPMEQETQSISKKSGKMFGPKKSRLEFLKRKGMK